MTAKCEEPSLSLPSGVPALLALSNISSPSSLLAARMAAAERVRIRVDCEQVGEDPQPVEPISTSVASAIASANADRLVSSGSSLRHIRKESDRSNAFLHCVANVQISRCEHSSLWLDVVCHPVTAHFVSLPSHKSERRRVPSEETCLVCILDQTLNVCANGLLEAFCLPGANTHAHMTVTNGTCNEAEVSKDEHEEQKPMLQLEKLSHQCRNVHECLCEVRIALTDDQRSQGSGELVAVPLDRVAYGEGPSVVRPPGSMHSRSLTSECVSEVRSAINNIKHRVQRKRSPSLIVSEVLRVWRIQCDDGSSTDASTNFKALKPQGAI